MNRSAKGFRVVSSLFLLLNLVAFFFPVTVRTQENYAALTWRQPDYIKSLFAGELPYDGGMKIEAVQMIWILCFFVLPVLLVLISGIWGIVGNYMQKVSSFLAFVVLVLYAGMYIFLGILWPDAARGQAYQSGAACMIHLAVSGSSTVAAVIALICTPKKMKASKESNIPQVQEIKQQQVEARYNVILENSQKEQKPKAYVPGNPRGVLVGLTGVYAGAEIPLTSGEYIKLGRQTDNHLVFEGQPRVSRSHCKIKWDAGRKRYVFCDYSNSGTFVNGSDECLPHNLEMDMAPGTVIALGDETNTFRLE